MNNLKIPKKFVPITIIFSILIFIWLIFMGIPLFNDLIQTINHKVPQPYKLPLTLSFISILTLLVAIYGWKVIYPVAKNSVMNKYDKPSLAVVMSGSSGVGVLNAFKKITDTRFASAIKGVLFDVEKEKPVRDNKEGAIDAFRYPVQPAQSGFKGASGARDIEYEEAKNSFYKFFKPFARKINSVVRITGIGKGNTSISSTVKFDFADFKDFPGTEKMTLFDFIVVERTDDENLKSNQGKFNSNIDALVKIHGNDFYQNGIVLPQKSFILTPSVNLKGIGSDDLNIVTKSGKKIKSEIVKFFDEYHLALLNYDEDFISYNFEFGNSYIDQPVSKISLNEDSEIYLQENYVKAVNSEFGLIQTNNFENSNCSTGSPLISENGKLLGISINSEDPNLFISSKAINECLEFFQKETTNQKGE